MSEEECPRNDTGHWMRFHPDMRECVPLDMVPQEHGGRMPKCEGREDGNYRDDKGRCNQFTVCVSGAVAEIIKCKDGEVYDTLPQKCVEEAEACEPCGEMNRWYVLIIINMIYFKGDLIFYFYTELALRRYMFP